MSVHWTTHEPDGTAFDPEPDDEDDGPWCQWPHDLWGQGIDSDQLDTMTDVHVTGSYL